MSAQSLPDLPPKAAPASLGFNLAGIAAIVLLLAVGAAYLIDELGRAERAHIPSLADGDPITQTLGATELHIPTAWFRYGEQIRDGFTSQIDLTVTLASVDGAPSPVQVTLLPRSRARASSSLLDAVYLHQFEEETLTGVAGLVGKPLADSSGFSGESVWYDALAPNPFVAKCMAAIAPGASEQCVRTVHLPTGIAAVYAFDATLLQSWRDFDNQIQQWLTPIGAL